MTTQAAPTTPSAAFARRSAQETASQLDTNPISGLTSQEANKRRLQYGSNEFDVDDDESIYLKFLKSFYENPLILLLLASAVVSLAMGQRDDAISITLAILIVVTVAFVQEYRSEKSLEALNKLVPHHCHVIRDDSQQSSTLASQLVPGDLVKFGIGDRIPADCRLVTAVDLEIDESNLTGENKPCRKQTEAIVGNEYTELSITERKNIAYMGTLVRNGHGTGIVVGISKETEFGVVFCMMQEVEIRKTPLQLSMDELGKKLSMLSFVIIGVIVLIGLFQGKHWLEMMTIGVSLAVAAIPEGLPIVVTVTLALGVLRMANRKAIIKKLPSVETLGSVNVVCADKTGTLTMNQMTLTKVFTLAEGFPVELDKAKDVDVDLHPGLRRLLQIGNLCNNAFLDDHSKWIGQPTDIALIEVLRGLGITDERPSFERISEFPFNSEQKFMHVRCAPLPGGNAHKITPEHAIDPTNAAVGQSGSPGTIYFKGAIEPVLERCVSYYRSEGSNLPLDVEAKEKVMAQANEMASHGLRVLAMAFGNDLERLTFVGIVGMHDPPRPGVEDSIRTLVGSGVKVIMITGDADATALSIARRLGFPINPGKSSCLTGPEIESMTERQLQDAVGTVCVFARTTPKHKMAIVSAFQAKGCIVAMTGDGVNDAPALKLADIGISMGRSGTDVAKEAADMILVDDDFSTILGAVEEGKSIFYNIQNFLTFQLSTSVAALTLIAMATLFGLNNPLNAMQILWINILMDGPPAQSLGVEPVDDEVMKKPPRARDAPILTRLLIRRVLTSAMIIVAGTMFVYVHEMTDGSVTARDTTMTFTTFVFFDMFNALACRSEKKSAFSIGFTTNKMFNYSVLGSVIGQFLVIYMPFFQTVFQTEALSFTDLLGITLLTSTVFWAEEARKFFGSRKGEKMHGRNAGQGFRRVETEEGEAFEIV
ncbi:High affinity Ca2+/Mn2+ P-type ATPase-like protein [Entomortierella lignicola]|nr:High affinity Ca2+/Mn2+ P-type ATPase-like protein [Entomortierella lignicola]